MADDSTATDYLSVTFPFDTTTSKDGLAVRLFGHDGHRVTGAVLVNGLFIDTRLWEPDGYVLPAPGSYTVPDADDGAATDMSGHDVRSTDIYDLVPPPGAVGALIAAQQAIVTAAQATVATINAKASADWTADDMAAMAAASAAILAAQAEIVKLGGVAQ